MATTKLEMEQYPFDRFHLGYGGGLGVTFFLGEAMQFRLEAEYNQSVRAGTMLSPESGKHGYRVVHFGGGVSFRL